MAIYEGKKITMNVTAHTSEATDASEVSYDNTESGLEATDVQAAVDELKTDIDKKADVDGSYEGMTVGNAEQLISSVGLADKSPYLFRTAGGALEIGNRSKVKKIIGASVPIIQCYNANHNTETISGITFTKNSDGSVTVSAGTAEADIWKNLGINFRGTAWQNYKDAQHKWLLFGCPIGGSTSTYSMVVRYINAGLYDTGNGCIWTYTGSTANTGNLCICIKSGTVISSPLTFKPIAIDLTATFGTTVANRLYALEQAQAGTGIAKAKEILVKDYYPYNVTAFTHTKTSGKVNVGFNAYNHETGTAQLVGGNVYQLTGAYTSLAYVDDNGNTETITPDANGLFTPTYDGTLTITGGNDTTTCVHLHWDGERDGEYETYQEWNYSVQDIELKGIISLDAQDNWVADGDEYPPDGSVTIIYIEYTFTGNEEWTYSPVSSSYPYGRFNLSLLPLKKNGIGNIRCNKYVTNDVGGYTTDKVILGRANAGAIYIIDSDYTDVDTFKAAMTGVKILYPLAIPTQTTADQYTELQNDSNWGTEKWIDTRDVPLPVFSETEYLLDIKAKVEAAPDSPTIDGDYVMHRENGTNSYVSIASWLSSNGYAPNVVPAAPTTDGNYVLKVTVADGVATYSWEAQS